MRLIMPTRTATSASCTSTSRGPQPIARQRLESVYHVIHQGVPVVATFHFPVLLASLGGHRHPCVSSRPHMPAQYEHLGPDGLCASCAVGCSRVCAPSTRPCQTTSSPGYRPAGAPPRRRCAAPARSHAAPWPCGLACCSWAPANLRRPDAAGCWQTLALPASGRRYINLSVSSNLDDPIGVRLRAPALG
jgi:hypothetical protein